MAPAKVGFRAVLRWVCEVGARYPDLPHVVSQQGWTGRNPNSRNVDHASRANTGRASDDGLPRGLAFDQAKMFFLEPVGIYVDNGILVWQLLVGFLHGLKQLLAI